MSLSTDCQPPEVSLCSFLPVLVPGHPPPSPFLRNQVGLPFAKFFNADEPHAAELAWGTDDLVVAEKVDGTLCFIYHYGGAWRVGTTGKNMEKTGVGCVLSAIFFCPFALCLVAGTFDIVVTDGRPHAPPRSLLITSPATLPLLSPHCLWPLGSPNAGGQVMRGPQWQAAAQFEGEAAATTEAMPPLADGIHTFADLFWATFRDLGYKVPHGDGAEDYTFMFELVSPWNQIVVPHETADLILLGARSRVTMGEVSLEDAATLAATAYHTPHHFEGLSTRQDLSAYFATADPLHCEGFVVRDAAFARVKVKHPGYVAIHHLADGLSMRRILEIVRHGESAEMLAYFPQWADAFEPVIAAYEALCADLERAWEACETAADLPGKRGQKQYKLQVSQARVPAAMHALRSGAVANVRAYVATMDLKEALSVMGIDDFRRKKQAGARKTARQKRREKKEAKARSAANAAATAMAAETETDGWSSSASGGRSRKRRGRKGRRRKGRSSNRKNSKRSDQGGPPDGDGSGDHDSGNRNDRQAQRTQRKRNSSSNNKNNTKRRNKRRPGHGSGDGSAGSPSGDRQKGNPPAAVAVLPPVLADMPWFRHGSPDSTDRDVVYVAAYLPPARDCHAFCDLGLAVGEDRNVVVVRDGVVVASFKGAPDEVNNAILATIGLHDENDGRPPPVERAVDRDVVGKAMSVLTGVIGRVAHHTAKKGVRAALKRALASHALAPRVQAMAGLEFGSGANHRLGPDVLKAIAFQLGQARALMDGVEVYSKGGVRDLYPAIAPLIDRQPVDDDGPELAALSDFCRAFAACFDGVTTTKVTTAGKGIVLLSSDPAESIEPAAGALAPHCRNVVYNIKAGRTVETLSSPSPVGADPPGENGSQRRQQSDPNACSSSDTGSG